MIQIRKAKDSDLSQLELLFLRVRQKTFFWEPAESFKIEDYRKYTENEKVYVAEDQNKKLLGFIAVLEGDYPFIHHLYVSLESQKKGIGTLLIKHLFLHFPLPYRLKCLVSNVEALHFYAKIGFLLVEQGIGESGEYALLELNSCSSLFNSRSV